MRPLLPRERLLLAAVVMIAAVVGFVLLVYRPRTAEADRLMRQLRSQQHEVMRVRAEAQRKSGLEGQVAHLRVSIRNLEGKLPSAREIPSLLLQLDDLAAKLGVDLRKIRPGELRAATAPQPAPAASSPLPVGEARPAARPLAGKPTAAPAVQPYERFTLEMAVQGDFDALLAFMRGIEDFPRFLAISDVQLTLPPSMKAEDPASPRLTLAVTASAYVVPGSEGVR